MARKKPLVVFSIAGTTLDGGGAKARLGNARRWDRWRPTVDLARHAELPVARVEVLHQPAHVGLAAELKADIEHVAPGATARLHPVAMRDPWDFEEVYAALFDFCKGYAFNTDDEDYLVHITTGTHVAQICWFLLAESKVLPGNLLQTSPPRDGNRDRIGSVSVVDLDLSRYDRLRQRFQAEAALGVASLKHGVATRNAGYNALIDELEHVASSTAAPILLLGATGSGKTWLARRIYELKKTRRQVAGPFVEVNCATLRGDGAMSTLFGHKKGAFTGAAEDREGLLLRADGGVLFLDEVGELGLDEQAMLLRAIEEKRFLPLGADKERTSSFQLLCGTHRDLRARVHDKLFREDLLARIDIWTFALPPLRDRLEDVEPNIDLELKRISTARAAQVTMNREARAAFVEFATTEATWPGNFRELAASMERMATLCRQGRVTVADVEREIERKRRDGAQPVAAAQDDDVQRLLGTRANDLDDFDRVQLAHVLHVCRESRSLAEAGRRLFAASRAKRASVNDSDRLRKYLMSWGLTFEHLRR